MMKNDGTAAALTCLKNRLVIRAASVVDDHDRRKVSLLRYFAAFIVSLSCRGCQGMFPYGF